MTLTETAQLLGNFGEFIGAIAVVPTLTYLAIQIRQSNVEAQAGPIQEFFNSWDSVIVANPDPALIQSVRKWYSAPDTPFRRGGREKEEQGTLGRSCLMGARARFSVW